MPPTPPPPPLPPLTLIIRFTTSLPDLPLQIPQPRRTTPLALAALIRPHLPPALSARAVRLIHAGALLPANVPLHASLRLSATGKSPARLYVHCAVSADDTPLPAALLDAETSAALRSSSGRNEDVHDDDDDDDDDAAGASSSVPSATDATAPPPTLPPPPQGFDRLLSAGLTPAEVSALRTQFLAVQAHTHTPDTMPSAAEMRALEERWLDAGAMPGGGNGGGDGATGGGWDEEGGAGGGLEDMLWGNVMGFFWAVGAIVWLVREEGVWSKRRQVGVVTGVLVNIAFCMLRVGV